MMWQFARENPLLFALIFWGGVFAVTCPVICVFRAYRNYLRAMNIYQHGWPTAPVDADGSVIWPNDTNRTHR